MHCVFVCVWVCDCVCGYVCGYMCVLCKGVYRGGATGAAAPPLGNLTARKAIKIMIFI